MATNKPDPSLAPRPRGPMGIIAWTKYVLSLPFGPGTGRRAPSVPRFITPEEYERQNGRRRPPLESMGGHIKD